MSADQDQMLAKINKVARQLAAYGESWQERALEAEADSEKVWGALFGDTAFAMQVDICTLFSETIRDMARSERLKPLALRVAQARVKELESEGREAWKRRALKAEGIVSDLLKAEIGLPATPDAPAETPDEQAMRQACHALVAGLPPSALREVREDLSELGKHYTEIDETQRKAKARRFDEGTK